MNGFATLYGAWQTVKKRRPTRQRIVLHEVVVDTEAGLRLTLVGMGTAFALLFLLMLVMSLMGWLVRRTGRGGQAASGGLTDADGRDRALAAVVAVTTVLAKGDADGTGA